MNIIEVLKLVSPETATSLNRRYTILRAVDHLAPVGRRVLADNLHVGERIIRTELDELKQLDLIETGSAGVSLTPRGQGALTAMAPYILELLGLPNMELRVSEHLGIPRVMLVPGDSSADPLVKKELGRAAARVLKQEIRDGDIIAITGGTTMSAVADSLRPQRHRVTVVPGRGALGERVEIQANTIAAKLAQALGGNYRMLHAPDNLSRQALDEMLRDPGIAEILALIHRSTLLVHGIGDALEMAARRQMPQERIADLKNLDATAEALGYYFNLQGEIVWHANSIGLGIDDLENIKTVIVVAGGADKAPAIRAVAAHHKWNILVTDQGAAEDILQGPPVSTCP
jgi:central glycolytic genes regulator